jgi:hypothetical protein
MRKRKAIGDSRFKIQDEELAQKKSLTLGISGGGGRRLEIAHLRFKMGKRKAIGDSRFKIQDGELAQKKSLMLGVSGGGWPPAHSTAFSGGGWSRIFAAEIGGPD